MILIDWDDTLLCSSFLSQSAHCLSTPLYDLSRPLEATDSAEVREAHEVAMQLRDLEACVCAVLKQAIAAANRVVIVTNAEHGWCQLSAAKFLPSVVPLLDHLHVVSARSAFEHVFPDSPLRWKYSAMSEILHGSGFFGRDGRVHVDKHVISCQCCSVARASLHAG